MSNIVALSGCTPNKVKFPNVLNLFVYIPHVPARPHSSLSRQCLNLLCSYCFKNGNTERSSCSAFTNSTACGQNHEEWKRRKKWIVIIISPNTHTHTHFPSPLHLWFIMLRERKIESCVSHDRLPMSSPSKYSLLTRTHLFPIFRLWKYFYPRCSLIY